MSIQSSSRVRLISLLIYAALLCVVQKVFVVSGLTPNENSIWLYNGLASLLFGSRLLYPYFTPPADAATNAFAALSSMIAGSLAISFYSVEAVVLGSASAFCALVLLLALIVLIARPPQNVDAPNWVKELDRAVRQLGGPNVIFTVVIFAAAWMFHRNRPVELFWILASYTIITVLRPIEAVMEFVAWAYTLRSDASDASIIGPVAAYQTPNIALIRQSGGDVVRRGRTLLIPGEQGTWLLGVALNYVGRDEGNLLRVLTTSLPNQLSNFAQSVVTKPSDGHAIDLSIPEDQAQNVQVLEWIARLCGLVDSDTTLDFLQFEVIDEEGLSEGRLVESRIADQRSVLFQLIGGVTHEEIVQQKNKYGYVRAKARKIGNWDQIGQKFVHVPWLPSINSPVFLREEIQHVPSANAIGHFPKTSFEVSIDIGHAVTHNTAILGILGIGKTFLAAEMIERMIDAGTKVVCFDLTNQYAVLLSQFRDANADAADNAALTAAGANGVANHNRELGGSRHVFKDAALQRLRAFLDPQNARNLWIINPSQFGVTKQISGMFNNNAELSTLTPCEITAILSEAALMASQELGMTDVARTCLVYEEAHSLVPEWNSVVSEGDKNATVLSAKAILQGRKFGLGALVITQRTANVTKTILNQCNTIIAMRTFDDTGKEFLSNYIGADYAGVLPSLEARHAVIFGKASSCENPVLIRLNDRDAFLQAFRVDPI